MLSSTNFIALISLVRTFDLNHRVRVSALESILLGKQNPFTRTESSKPSEEAGNPEHISKHITITVGACNSLLITFDPLALPRQALIDHLINLEPTALGDLSTVTLPTRLFKLPITFSSKEQAEATKRYMQTQRPHAPYLPDNLQFVAKNNAFTADHLKSIFTTGL